MQTTTTTRPALSRTDRTDIARFVADLARGKVSLGWRPFVLAFRTVSAERMAWALAEVLPFCDTAELARDPYLYEPARVTAFAGRHGAEDPELFVPLINACANANSVAEGQVADILRAALDGAPLD